MSYQFYLILKRSLHYGDTDLPCQKTTEYTYTHLTTLCCLRAELLHTTFKPKRWFIKSQNVTKTIQPLANADLQTLRLVIWAKTRFVSASPTAIRAPCAGSINPLIGCSPIAVADPVCKQPMTQLVIFPWNLGNFQLDLIIYTPWYYNHGNMLPHKPII